MNYILYDLEATCWLGRPPKGVQEIIEIGAVKVNAFGEVLGDFNRFVKPVVNPILSGFCTRLTTITQDDVNQAKTFPKVIEDFKDWINIYDEEYWLCSWGDFDVQMLRRDCILHQLEHDWLEPFINIKNQYKDLKKLDKGPGLKKSTKQEGFDFTGKHHRAIADAENMSKIFIKYIDEWVFLG